MQEEAEIVLGVAAASVCGARACCCQNLKGGAPRDVAAPSLQADCGPLQLTNADAVRVTVKFTVTLTV